MSTIEVVCPECSRRLRLSAEDRAKSIRCPACRCLFSLRSAPPQAASPAPTTNEKPGPSDRAPRKAAAPRPGRRRGSQRRSRAVPRGSEADPWESLPDERLFDDDFNSYADVEAADPPSPTRRRRRRSSRRDPVRTLLTLLMGFAAAGAIGGVGYTLYHFLPSLRISGFSNVVDLAYMPEHIEAFARIEVADVMGAPVIQPLLDANPDFRRTLTAAGASADFRPEDIDSLTFGFWKRDGSAAIDRVPAVSPFPGFSGARNNTEYLMVLRANRALSDSNFGMAETEEYEGTQYQWQGDFAIWIPDSYTAVLGSRDAVVEAIRQGSSSHRFSKFDFVDSGYDILFAGYGTPDAAAPSGVPSPSFNKLQTTLNQSARGVALGVNVGASLDANAQVWCRNATQANALAAEMTGSIADGKAEVNRSRGNPMLMPFMTHIDSVLNSLSVDQSGDMVRLRASVQQSTIEAITQLVPMMR